jgi:hypothetical protein
VQLVTWGDANVAVEKSEKKVVAEWREARKN